MKVLVATAWLLLTPTLILSTPSTNIINSDCTHEFYTETFQQFKERSDIEAQKLNSRKAMTKAIAKYKENKRLKQSKKCQILTKLQKRKMKHD